MKIQYDHHRKLCIIWLNKAEKAEGALKTALEATFMANKARAYKTVIFESGTQELYENTRDLLIYNKRLLS